MLLFNSSDKKTTVIDVGLNFFLYKRSHGDGKLTFNQTILLESLWVEKIRTQILDIQKDFPDRLIGIYIEFIHTCMDKRAFAGFANDIINPSNIFFYGLLSGTDLPLRILKDLKETGHDPYFDEDNAILYLNRPDVLDSHQRINGCVSAINCYLEEVIKGTITYREEPEMLSSSNIYATCYVDIKKLFLCPQHLDVMIYQMARELLTYTFEYDSLVCTSKNGAVLASISGQMLNIDVTYCINIGPQFAISEQTVNQAFVPGKKYVYVYDFICLGTEVKILQALLSSRQCTLVAGIGVASYIPLDNEDLGRKHSPLAVVSCMINLIRAGIQYKITVVKEDN